MIYDEWFDDDFKKTKHNFQDKRIKTNSDIHEFFYAQSKYRIGGSENKLELETIKNPEILIKNNYPEKYSSPINKGFLFFKKLTQSKFKFNITEKFIYSFSIISFVFIFGLIFFFISEYKKNDSSITNKSLNFEKEF